MHANIALKGEWPVPELGIFGGKISCGVVQILTIGPCKTRLLSGAIN